MKSLLYKEWKLAIHPTTFIFMSFGAMLIIPSYPSYVAFFYMCLSIFFLFLSGRENKDVFFTVMLPIKKSDVVKARCVMIAIIEIAQILISIPFAILRTVLYGEAGNLAGIEPNFAFYGLVFVMFSLFNFIMISGFYKTAYKIGKPLIYAMLAIVLYYGLVELLIWIPSPLRAFLDTMDSSMILYHLPILIMGILIWLVSFVITYRFSANRFEKVDL